MAQPKDSGPRDGVNNPETRPNVLATHQVMFLIAVTTTLLPRHSGFDADRAQWIGTSTQDGRRLPGSIHVGGDGDRDHPILGNIQMRWHYSPVAMWRLGLQIRFKKSRIPGLHRSTQRTWVAFQVGLKAPGKVKMKGRQQRFWVP
jgi:hypothetical protein